jgi:hypothetical protein
VGFARRVARRGCRWSRRRDQRPLRLSGRAARRCQYRRLEGPWLSHNGPIAALRQARACRLGAWSPSRTARAADSVDPGPGPGPTEGLLVCGGPPWPDAGRATRRSEPRLATAPSSLIVSPGRSAVGKETAQSGQSRLRGRNCGGGQAGACIGAHSAYHNKGAN